MKNLVLIAVLFCANLVLTGSNAAVEKQGKNSSSELIDEASDKLQKDGKMSRLELETKFHLLQNELKKKDKKLILDEKIERIREIANKLIKQAAAETDPAARQKLLMTAAELNEHPIETEERLKKDALLKEQAQQMLHVAQSEEDPLKQAKMIKTARDIIYKLKTGHKPLYRKHLTREQIQTATESEVNEMAQEKMSAYMSLAKDLTAKGDEKKAKFYLDRINNLMSDPRSALLRQHRHRKRRELAQKKIDQLLEKVTKENDPEAKKKLLDMANFLEHHPNKGMKKYNQEVEQRLMNEAKEIAKKLLIQAKDDQDPKRQRAKMIAAKKLLDKPLNTLKEMKMKELQRTYLLTVPETCKRFVSEAFHHTVEESNLKKLDLDKIEPMKLIGFAAKTIRDEKPERNLNKIQMTKIEPIVTGQQKELISKGKKIFPEKEVVFKTLPKPPKVSTPKQDSKKEQSDVTTSPAKPSHNNKQNLVTVQKTVTQNKSASVVQTGRKIESQTTTVKSTADVSSIIKNTKQKTVEKNQIPATKLPEIVKKVEVKISAPIQSQLVKKKLKQQVRVDKKPEAKLTQQPSGKKEKKTSNGKIAKTVGNIAIGTSKVAQNPKKQEAAVKGTSVSNKSLAKKVAESGLIKQSSSLKTKPLSKKPAVKDSSISQSATKQISGSSLGKSIQNKVERKPSSSNSIQNNPRTTTIKPLSSGSGSKKDETNRINPSPVGDAKKPPKIIPENPQKQVTKIESRPEPVNFSKQPVAKQAKPITDPTKINSKLKALAMKLTDVQFEALKKFAGSN